MGSTNGDDLDEALSRKGRPRNQYYLFAHRALPGLALRHPARIRELLSGPSCEAFLRDLWKTVGAGLGPENIHPPDGLERVHIVSGADRASIVVRLPEPEYVTEVFFAAFVFCEAGRPATRTDGAPGVRYFTLELSIDDETMLCEWTADGAHHNLGAGPAPELGAFEAAVERIVG